MASFGQALNNPPPAAAAARASRWSGQPLARTASSSVTKPNPLPVAHALWFELWVATNRTMFSSDGMPSLKSWEQTLQMYSSQSRQVVKSCVFGAMAYMSDGMTMKVQLAGLAKTFGRLAGGGSLFQVMYTNETDQDGYIAMTPDYPGVIVPINMASCPSGKIVSMRDSFLCATVGLGDVMTDVGAGFNPATSVGGFCCNGVDFIVQTVSNGEWAFLMVRTHVEEERHEIYILIFCCQIHDNIPHIHIYISVHV
jgi:hypothetical protein